MLATAVVQANQCSSGGECLSGGEPKHLVSLLQTKLNVLEDGPLLMKDPSAMLTELEGMVRSGKTPTFDLIATVRSVIINEVMPAHQATRDDAAKATTDHLSKIHSCHNKSKTEEDNIAQGRQKSVQNARSTHTACREAEKELYDHNLTHVDSYCVKLGKFLHGAKPLEIQDGSTRGDAVIYVKDAADENMCGLTQVTELDNGCTDSETELTGKKSDCSVDQRLFELEFCTWKTELQDNCDELDTCHAAALAAYHSHVNKTQELVKKWNVESKAHHKILCFTNVWTSDKSDGEHGDGRSAHNASHFDVCKDQEHTPPDVDYGMPPAKVTCPLTSVANHPGTSGFITQEFSNFTDFFEAVIPCTTVAS